MLAYLLSYAFEKIPFTCSYLPGKTYVQMAVLTFFGFLFAISQGIRYEMRALDDPAAYARMIAALAVGNADCAPADDRAHANR